MLYHILFLTKSFLANMGISTEKGQTLVEYAMLLLFIVLVVIGAITFFGQSLLEYYDNFTEIIAGL